MSAHLLGTIPSTTPSTAADHLRPLPTTGRQRVGQAGRDAVYLLAGWPLALVGFVLVITLLSVGGALAILGIGLVLMATALLIARAVATVERHAVASLTGRPAPTNAYASAPRDASGLGRLLVPLRDTQSWLDVLWLSVGFVAKTVTWSLALIWVVGALATVAGPVTTLILERHLADQHTGLAELLHLPFAVPLDVLMQFVVGLVFLLTAPAVLRGLAGAQTWLAETMLNSRARSLADVQHLTTSRDAARRVETDALRRLERDIHDGPQQRLVRLTMDLARARRQAESEPERAASMIEEAMTQSQAALAELRQLSRRIAPPILVDRGLEAALIELAGRSVIPATVYASLPELPTHVATTAYFVVSEALANANKHSEASHVDVVAALQDGALYLTVTDDGAGGASTAKGHGLAGLGERLRSVDGTFSLTSPEGGPTSLGAVIPCAS